MRKQLLILQCFDRYNLRCNKRNTSHPWSVQQLEVIDVSHPAASVSSTPTLNI
jgi:hypothetical protein